LGLALAVGDFDGDGYVDLAVGVPGEDVGTVTDAGAVHVLYGAGDGLTAADNRLWHQDSADIEGVAENYDYFGQALAAGDFDGDGYKDLAVGVPAENIGTLSNVGGVNIIYGSASGLTATDNQLWHQAFPDIDDTAEVGDQFGYSLAAADFDGDGRDDLAVGVVYEDVGNVANAGAVNVIYGSADGLTAAGDWWFHQDTPDILDAVLINEMFGWALAAGDFDGNGYADLAIGVPGEDCGSTSSAGAVHVVFGSSAGLTAAGNQFWHQDIFGVQDTAEAWDRLGRALAVGDFDGDGYDDLVIGVPYEDVGSTVDAGAVNVMYGADGGLTITGNWWFHQDTPGFLDTPAEEYDYFGQALAAGDFDGDGFTDLAIGAPYEDVGITVDAGAVNVVFGSTDGLTAAGNQYWHQDSTDVLNTAEDGDRFGQALAALPPEMHNVYLPLVLRD
jgi:hypothetical protein